MAEVLITLGIIGVVAAITLPALITNIQDRIKEKRVQNIQQKFSKATDKMLSISGLNGYESTLDFVNELKNHLSIAKICENDELRNCWPTEKVTIDDEGHEWEIAETKTGKALKMKNDDEHEWSDTVGLITGDGTSMILSYNKKCDIEPTATSNWTSDKSSSTNCVAAVFDWNGSSKPNAFGVSRADILPLNANGLGQVCFVEINNNCYGAMQTASEYLTINECEAVKDKLGISQCCSQSGCYGQDRWAWAVQQCGHVDNMMAVEDLVAIASKIYNKTVSMDSYIYGKYIYGTYNGSVATSLGFPSSSGFGIFSGFEHSGGEHAYGIRFYDSMGDYVGKWKYEHFGFFCKVE